MKIFWSLVFCLIFNLPIKSQENCDNLIQSLSTLLFEKNFDEKGFNYSYWSILNQDSINIKSHYNLSRKQKYVDGICDTLRWANCINCIPKLKKVLKRHETEFLESWEPVFDYVGGPEGLWTDQYNSLCLIDLTIGYLIISNQNWTPQRKYKYLKNLYMLNYGDYNKNRTSSTIYESDYILNERNGYCQCGLIQGANLDLNLIDEFFYDDNNLISVFIEDIKGTKNKKINDDDKKYYSSGMRNILMKNDDDRIDSLLLADPTLFINIGYDDNIDLLSTELSIKFYHILLKRYIFVNRNTNLIDLLLDDAFSELINKNSNRGIRLIYAYNDDLINYMIVERLMDLFLETEISPKLENLISFCNDKFNSKTKDLLLYKVNNYWKGSNIKKAYLQNSIKTS